MKKDKHRIDNPILFLIVMVLFLISTIVLTVGLLRTRGNQLESINLTKNKKESSQEENSISSYFKDEFARRKIGDDEFLGDDPFKDVCAETSGDGVPVITFGTVCVR